MSNITNVSITNIIATNKGFNMLSLNFFFAVMPTRYDKMLKTTPK
ncbi:hypothetical protein SDC9_203117 [bioreactor metagenome]|uniref:Uncharacterized protein n=1 Tax=bioreactor metagenome TaxID=1076179 RepID=A0A645IVI3_9ZZZZ